MGVVVAQSRATAHVYRMFGALVVLVVLMALAVAFTRVGRPTPSPYGGLASVSESSAPAVHPPVPAVVAAATPPSEPGPSSIAGAPSAPATTDQGQSQPRLIALNKAASTASVPQPAPPALVEAAARAAAAAPVDTSVPAAPASPNPDARAPGDVAPSSGRININTASAEELNSIPGAGRIGRTIMRHRPYRSLEDLVDHRVLKARDFAKIRSAITVE